MAAALKSNVRSAASQLGARKAVSVRRAAPVARRAVVVRAAADQKFDADWLKRDPFVFGVSFLGWTVPSSIPVSAFGGNSLFGSFLGSISENLAHFPTPPALDDKFWLYLLTWHVGLFVTLTLGQVGAQGKKQQYW